LALRGARAKHCTTAFLDAIIDTKSMLAHAAVRRIIAVVGAATVAVAQSPQPSDAPLAPGRAEEAPEAAHQDDPAGDVDLLNAPFRHFLYEVEVDRNGEQMAGRGEMWMWFGEGNLHLRIMSFVNSNLFGKGFINLIINPHTKTLYVLIDLAKLHLKTCVIYPFPDYDPLRAAKLKTRAEQVSKWASGGYSDGPLKVPWTKSTKLELRTSPSGQVQGVDLVRGDRVVKRVVVQGDVGGRAPTPDNVHDLFSASNKDCTTHEAAEGLAHLNLKEQGPQHASTLLSDLLLMMTGPEEHSQTFLTLSTLALPGDIGVMMEDPPPPRFEGHQAFAFSYRSTVFLGGRSEGSHSEGYVWMDLNHRALLLRGDAAHTAKGPFSMRIFARTDSQAKVYSEVNLTATDEYQCVFYDYPKLPVSQVTELNAFAAETLAFYGVGDAQGEDCAIFTAFLDGQHELRVWVDLEDSKLSAILQIEVWKKVSPFVKEGKILRRTEILHWHEAPGLINEQRDVSYLVHTERCSDSVTTGHLAHLGLNTVHERSSHLQNALYSLNSSTINFAVLQLLALPGDIAVVLEGDSAGIPSGKVLNAPYMHFDFRMDASQANMQHTGSGHMWLWFTEGLMYMKMTTLVQSPRYGDGKISLVFNPKTATLYILSNFEVSRFKDCIVQAFPKHLDAAVLERLEERWKVIDQWASASTVEPLHMKWTSSKTLDLRLDQSGKLHSVSIMRGDRVVSSLTVEGPVKEGNRPPPSVRELMSLGNRIDGCRLQRSMDGQRSSAVADFAHLMAAPRYQSQALLSVVAFTLPGDAAVMVNNPDAPRLDKLRGLSFDYRSTVWKNGVRAQSKGSIWMDLKERAFRLMGEAEHTKMGPFLMYLVARAGSDPKVYSDVELAARHEQQCVAYTYPELPKLQADELKEFVAKDLVFKDVGITQGDDCAIFVAPLPRGRELHVWVDLERNNQDAIMRSEVWRNGKILRRTEVLDWHKGKDAVLEALLVPDDRWQCSDDYGSGELACLGLHTVHERSSELQDALFALRRSPLKFAVLQLLALPGDVAVALHHGGEDRAPEVLTDPASEDGQEEGGRVGSFLVISLVVFSVLFIILRWECVKRVWLRQRRAHGSRGPMEDIRDEDEGAAWLATGPALVEEFGE